MKSRELVDRLVDLSSSQNPATVFDTDVEIDARAREPIDIESSVLGKPRVRLAQRSTASASRIARAFGPIVFVSLCRAWFSGPGPALARLASPEHRSIGQEEPANG